MEKVDRAFRESDPTKMNRLDILDGLILTFTNKTVADILGAAGKNNSVFLDPDNIGRLVHLQGGKGPADMFISLFFRGIIPTTNIVRGHACLGDTKRSGKKYRNRGMETREEYFSVEFDPNKIQETYSQTQYLAGEFLLLAFGDGDHADKIQNVAKNVDGDKFYFYDFLLDIKRLDKFFEHEEDPPYENYELLRKDVRIEFSKLVRILYYQYNDGGGMKLFRAIFLKSKLPEVTYEKTRDAFYQQLQKLYQKYCLI